MSPGRLPEAKLVAGKRLRERERDRDVDKNDEPAVLRSDAYSPPASLPRDRRSSRPKAPWPLDTFFGHASARVFGGGSGSKKDEARLRGSSRNEVSARALPLAAQDTAPAHGEPPRRDTDRQLHPPAMQTLASGSTPILVQARKKASLEPSDLPVTPPDSSMSDFRLPAVADLSRSPFACNKEPGAIGRQDDFARFLKQQSDAVESPTIAAASASPKAPSKNDIFNRRSVWITPAPAPSSAPGMVRNSSKAEASDASDKSSSPSDAAVVPQRAASKTSLFFSSASSPAIVPPPSAATRRVSATIPPPLEGASPRAPAQAANLSQPEAGQHGSADSPRVSSRHSRKASLGRANTEEREREQERIRQTKDVEFRLCPSKEFLLGEGRHCNVFLGSYYSKRKQAEPEADSPIRQGISLRSKLDLRGPDWKLCAIKRLHADRHSQLLGLDEAFTLRRLGPHPNIIRLIDIRDEVEFTPSPQPSPKAPPKMMPTGLGKGLPSTRDGEARGAAAAQDDVWATANAHASPHAHGRSTSDMTGRAEVLSETKTLKRVLAAQKEVEAASNRGIEVGRFGQAAAARELGSLRMERKGPRHSEVPVLKVASPEIDRADADAEVVCRGAPNVDGSSLLLPPASGVSSSGGGGGASSTDTPRLLILLDLLPNSLANYTRQFPERVDVEQWRCWAGEMASAVDWLHDRGCIHADLKKENMLLTDDLTIKLCDFNSAVFPNPNDPPTDGMGLGTPAYGAPELSRATGGPGASSFSFPIDIYSLGAVLYSLATGVEPFSNARSVIEILQRKKAFFDSEENSRVDRLAVEGGSNPTSSAASRSNSIRGRRKDRPEDAPYCLSPGAISRSLASLMMPSSPVTSGGGHRNASTDSLESVASSIATVSGHPSPYAIAQLLDPAPEPRGLLANENEAPRKGLLSPAFTQQSGVERRASMGRLQQKNGSPSLRLRSTQFGGDEAERTRGPRSAVGQASGRLNVPFSSRPDVLRRASSFGDGIQPGSESVSTSGVSGAYTPTSPTAYAALPSRIDEISSPPMRPSGLRTAVVPADLDTSPDVEIPDLQTPTLGRNTSQLPPWTAKVAPPPSAWPQSSYTAEEQANNVHHEDLRPYLDGHPALILAGGGRLPDEGRELLRSMVQARPDARPTAREVVLALSRL